MLLDTQQTPRIDETRLTKCKKTLPKTAHLRIIVALFLFFKLPVFGQNQNNNWYFGNEAAIRFVGNSPVSISTSNLISIEGCASVSDPITGDLLFYTNGREVWNRNDIIMPNGSNLAGGINTSSSQGSLIVPFPNDARKFFLFTADEAIANSSFDFRYSIIDLDLDNGLGDVITNQKNILIQSNVTERISVAKNASESGYWVLIHERDNNIFKAYEVTESGLNTTPAISNVGSIHSSVNQVNGNGTMGCMKFNNALNKLAVAIYSENKIELFDFDNCN